MSDTTGPLRIDVVVRHVPHISVTPIEQPEPGRETACLSGVRLAALQHPARREEGKV